MFLEKEMRKIAMKINVSDRKFNIVEKPDLSDISIGYIDNKNTENYVDFIIDENFAADSSERVMPYQKVSSSATLFFDGNNNIVKNINLKRLGNTWIYEPDNSTEYTPERFECSAIIKKSMKFTEEKTYSIKVCAGDMSDELDLCKKLINIFGNANKRGLCPSNIIVNNNKTEPESLLEYTVNNSDFIFMESDDGVNLPGGFTVDDVISCNTNLWISTENFDGITEAPITDTENNIYDPMYLEGRLVNFYTKTKRKAKITKIIKLSDLPEAYDDYDKEIVYDDILILDSKEKGSVIITPKEFLDNLNDNSSVLYDVMMYVYLKSYVQTKTLSSWITNEPVDKRAYSNSELNRYHEKINIKDMLNADIKEDDFSILRVDTNNPGVFLVDINTDKELFFRKNDKSTKDPVKNPEEISFLTTKQSIVNYAPENIYLMESAAKLSYKYIDDDLYVVVDPMVSSSHQIIIPESIFLKIENMSRRYYVCASQTEPEGISDVILVDSEKYSLTDNGIKIAEVIPKTKYSTKVYDIRIKGGGLPESFGNDYDLLDIGNPYGRPYRKGSTLIFRLPKQLEEHKDKLEKEIEKHIIASDIPIFVYDKEIE